jgi:hypothetical protein
MDGKTDGVVHDCGKALAYMSDAFWRRSRSSIVGTPARKNGFLILTYDQATQHGIKRSRFAIPGFLLAILVVFTPARNFVSDSST